jgi:IS30 family transposase
MSEEAFEFGKILPRRDKVTAEIKEEMKKMRGDGLSYAEIGKRLGFYYSTVQYHLDAEQREKAKIRATMSNEKQVKAGYYQRRWRKDGRHREYNRLYLRWRYHTDAEFRRKVLKANLGGTFAKSGDN